MSSAELALDLEHSWESLFQRLLSQFRFTEAAKEWSRWRQALTGWEDEHLLIDNPSPQKLEQHRRILERLMFFGQLFSLIANHPDFDDSETAEMIVANQHILRNKLRIFHSSMTSERADQILKEVFPES